MKYFIENFYILIHSSASSYLIFGDWVIQNFVDFLYYFGVHPGFLSVHSNFCDNFLWQLKTFVIHSRNRKNKMFWGTLHKYCIITICLLLHTSDLVLISCFPSIKHFVFTVSTMNIAQSPVGSVLYRINDYSYRVSSLKRTKLQLTFISAPNPQ